MTRDQTLDRVRLNLNDAGITFWSSSDANDSIQDGYDDVAVRTQCIEKTYTLASVAGLMFYNLYQQIGDYLIPKAFFNPVNNIWMDPITLMQLKTYGFEWEKATGPPTHFWPVSFEYTLLWPIYLGTTQNYTLLYAAQADTLSATTVPQIPNQFQNILEDYVTADLLEQAEENFKAQTYWTSYMSKVKGLKNFMLTNLNERLAMLSNIGRR